MKTKIIFILSSLYLCAGFCYSQNDSISKINLTLDKNPSFEPLIDCQVYSYSTYKKGIPSLESSFNFNQSGKIIEKLKINLDRAVKTIYSYKNDKLYETTHYNKIHDSILEIGKSINVYNENGQIIQISNYEYDPIFDKWEAVSEYLREYNELGQLQIERGIRKCEACNIAGEGTTQIFYDTQGRKLLSKFYWHNSYTDLEIKDTLDTVTKYKYSDGTYLVTSTSSNSIFIATYVTSSNGKLISKENKFIQGIKNKYFKGDYIANIDTLEAEYNLQSHKTSYQYDKFDRMEKIIEYHETSQIITEFRYRTNEHVVIPPEEYLEYYDDY